MGVERIEIMAEEATSKEMRPSLERLKGLDSLPNLQSQLHEARQLCNHSARADMISKWLLERLKSKPEFRSSTEAWETLLSTLRLLSPQRLASNLSSHGFLAACKAAIEDPTDPKQGAALWVIKRVLIFLFEVCAGSEGTQLKAVFSIPASEAASFLGAWVESILTLLGIAMLEDDISYDLLQPGIEIWNLRKRYSDENEEFAKHSFLPIARLLPVVSHYEIVQQRKRKSHQMDTPKLGYKQVPESMLARHVFVPARAAFFKLREASENSSKRQVGSQDPKFMLRSMMTTIREGGLDEGQLAVLPALFDVVIRSTPGVAPSQQFKERAWLDAVFEALHECTYEPDDSNFVLQAIEDILSIAKEKHISLSKPVLDRLIERHSGLGNGKTIAWKLISLVLVIDSDVFSDDDTAITLLTQTTVATTDLDKKASRNRQRWRSSVEPEVSGQEFVEFLRKQIAAPLMKAFADRRKLESFVDMWAAQIRERKSDNISAVWTDFGAQFAPMLEGSLTQSEILSIFDRYSISMARNTSSEATEDTQVSLRLAQASVVVLEAILGGVTTETLADALHERCGSMLKSLLDIRQEKTAPEMDTGVLLSMPQTWTLLMEAFELWFPQRIIAQPEVSAIGEFGTAILSSSAFNTTSIHDSSEPINHAAQTFVACVCSSLQRYGEVDCSKQVKMLGQNIGDDSRWRTLINFPNLISALEDREIMISAVECIHSKSSTAPDFLQLLASTAFQRTPQLADEFSEFLVLNIQPQDDDWDVELELQQEMTVLKCLSKLSPEPILRHIREKMIDAICQRQQEAPKRSDLAKSVQSLRIAVLTRLMKLSNATAKLATDAKEIWRLTRSIILEDDRSPIQFCKQLTIQLSGHLLATQDQERSRSMLVNLSEIVKDHVDVVSIHTKYDDGCDATSIFIDTLIEKIEIGAKEELKQKLVYRNQATMKLYLGTRIECIRLEVDRKGPHFEYAIRDPLKTLLATPQALFELSGIDIAAELIPLIESTMVHLKDTEAKPTSGLSERDTETRQDVLIGCFRIISRYAYEAGHSAIALNLAAMHLTPAQHHLFMSTSREDIEQLSRKRFTDVLNSLMDSLQDGTASTSAATLPLLEICAEKLKKAKLEEAESPMPRLLSLVLTTARTTSSTIIRVRALTCAAIALKSSDSSLINQHCIEMTLTGIKSILDNRMQARTAYLEVCQILSVILLQYRSRLHGRFHLVVPVFQALLSQLFEPSHSNGSTKKQTRSLTVRHAQAVAKLLSLFAEPPQSKRSSQSHSLVDEARREQAYVGKSTQYILHHHCAQLLTGRLGPGMKETITPGIWSIIEGMEMGEADGIKSLSAIMNNSERAVLRGVYDDWRRFGKWRGA